MKKKLLFPIILLLAGVILAFSIRGNVGDPIYYQDAIDSRVGGPFESTNSTARYVLIEAMVKNNSFFFTPDQAQSASPDVSEYKGRYMSLFTPGVSFIGIPFFIFGDMIGFPQLITFLSVFLFALLNMYLVYRLARLLGGNTWASIFSGFAFLFATNALTYAHTLTQHHMSTSVILIGLLTALGKKNIWNALIFGAAIGIGTLIDIPNLLMMVPIGLYMFVSYFSMTHVKPKIKLSVNASVLGLLLGVIPFIMLFGYYNYQTTGSYTTLAQSIGRPKGLDSAPDLKSIKKTQVKENTDSSFKLPFETRLQIGGIYTLLISDERSWLFYSPIVLLGIPGLFFAYRKRSIRTTAAITASVIIVNISIYTMFHDPWGGWSFGPRYLIPSAALLSAGVAVLLTRYQKNYILLPIIVLAFAYSSVISATGALTTNAIPPKVEAINLPSPIPYTYEYNFQMLEKNQLSGLVYNLYLANSVSASVFTYIYSSVIIISGGVLLLLNFISKKNYDN